MSTCSSAANPDRVLVVDDDPRLLASVLGLLGQEGLHTQAAGNGREAVEQLLESSFDLLLLDLKMPLMDGHQVMDFLHQLPDPPSVVVVSGETRFDDVRRTLKQGADDFLRKPYQPEELLHVVRNALQKRHLEMENRRMQKRLQDSEKLHRYLVDHSPDIIYLVDEEGRFTFINERVEALLGYSREELIGRHYETIVHPEDLAVAEYAFNERRARPRSSRNLEIRLLCKNRFLEPRHFETTHVTIELSAVGLYSASSEPSSDFLGSFGIARDVSAKKKAEAQLQHQLYHDLLTNLPNRALFRDRVALAINQARRNGEKLAVMFLDLDRFKVINDTLGHVIGDELLQGVAQRLTTCLRESDTLARVGGDEFNLLLPGLKSAEDAQRVAEKVIEALSSPIHVGEHELYISASIGLAVFPDHGDSPEQLIKNADIAMYHMKGHGKNGHRLFNTAMQASYNRHLELEHGLRKALESAQFLVVYQPQVDLADGRVCGLEALLRWQHPQQGLLSPGAFLQVAEESGLLPEIGAWVLERVCATIRHWRQHGLAVPSVAVNVSASQLEQPGFVERVKDTLKRHGLDGSDIELEITENALLADMEDSVDKLKRLSAAGVRIAIDDFGTGYSSMAYLQQLPLHTLKIDRSFISALRSAGDQAAIVDAIVAMGHGLGLSLVSEGIENEVQMRYMQRLRCQLGQGFLFSMPIDESEVEMLLESGTVLGDDAPARSPRRHCVA